MKPASCKAKGRYLQNIVSGLVRLLFKLSENDVRPAIMGESGTDIKLSSLARSRFPFAVECKNTEKINVYEFWKQATTNADRENLIPLLVVKRNRELPLAVMDLNDLFELLAELTNLRDKTT